MRTPLLSLTAAAAALAALLAAAPGADAAETKRGMRNAVDGPRHPCRALALRFDNTLSRMMGGATAAGSTDMGRAPAPGASALPDPESNRNMAAVGTTGGGMFERASEMRDEGMEACNAGRIEEGMRKLVDAVQALGT